MFLSCWSYYLRVNSVAGLILLCLLGDRVMKELLGDNLDVFCLGILKWTDLGNTEPLVLALATDLNFGAPIDGNQVSHLKTEISKGYS